MSEMLVMGILEIIGAWVRYSILWVINKLRKRKPKKFSYFLDRRKNSISNDYSNGLIGFVFIVFIFVLVYIITL